MSLRILVLLAAIGTTLTLSQAFGQSDTTGRAGGDGGLVVRPSIGAGLAGFRLVYGINIGGDLPNDVGRHCFILQFPIWTLSKH